MWLEYLRARSASESDIDATEQALGVSLPDDFVSFLTKYQGMRSETAHVTDILGRRIRLAYLFFFTTAAESKQRNIRDLCLMFRERGYPERLVPFGSTGGQPHVALDYSASLASPSVAYVYPDGDAPRTGYWSTTAVAPDVTSFLAMMASTGDA